MRVETTPTTSGVCWRLWDHGRLLATGKAEDLKKIAQAMTQKDNVPCVYRKPSPG